MNGSINGLPLELYRKKINLDQPLSPQGSKEVKDTFYKGCVDAAVSGLLLENPNAWQQAIPTDTEQKRALIKTLLTIREPKTMESCLKENIDAILQYENRRRGTIHAGDLPHVRDQYGTPDISAEFVLWQGDITRLDADAIVNAANNRMLGCFRPNHACIDNAIHSAAGPMLREDCAVIMELQGHTEPTGTAKITRGYHLPSKYVLHTVGPIIRHGTSVSDDERKLLASCYTSCLSLAAEIDSIRSVAFCGISTGVFGYPKQEATTVAVQAVETWLQQNPGRIEHIIFNVFGKEDLEAYERFFGNR